MTNEEKHTPQFGLFFLDGEDGEGGLAGIDHWEIGPFNVEGDELSGQQDTWFETTDEESARELVKRWNTHDQMLAALWEALAAFNDGDAAVPYQLTCHSCGVSSDRGHLDDGVHDPESACGKVVTAIKAAEAAATEGAN